MASTPDRRQTIERIQSTLQSVPAQNGTIDECASEIVALGGEIVAEIESEFDEMADPLEPSAA
jgi:hypothetical protein